MDTAIILGSFVGHGSLGLNGELGYEHKKTTTLPNYHTISAHAPSEVICVLPPDTEIFGLINEDVKGFQTSAHLRILNMNYEVIHDLGVITTEKQTAKVTLNQSSPVILQCETGSYRMCHTVWALSSPTELKSDTQDLMGKLFDIIRDIKPGNDSYEFYIQTCKSRTSMALTGIYTLLRCCKTPSRIVLYSFDDISHLRNSLPPWVEIWSQGDLKQKLRKIGISDDALNFINFRQFFAKYAIPRLLMGNRVLVSDDDVFWNGPCEDLINSPADITYIVDHVRCYGNNALRFFKSKVAGIDTETKQSPYVCAGLYMLSNSKVRDASIIDKLIIESNEHYDEQGSVALETFMDGVVSRSLSRPKYTSHSSPPSLQLEVVHLCGTIAHLRGNDLFKNWILHRALYKNRSEVIISPNLGGHYNRTLTDIGALEFALAETKAKSFLDVGCGTGEMVKLAHERGLRALGVEGDPTIINHKFMVCHDLNTRWIRLGKFDIIWCVEVLEHIDEQQNVVNTISRNIQLNGALIISAATPGQGGHHHVNERPLDYWISVFASSGFAFDRDRTNKLRKASTMSEFHMAKNGLWFNYTPLESLDPYVEKRSD